jgi:hypothetical protein
MAMNCGFEDYAKVRSDKNLAALRTSPKFEKLVNRCGRRVGVCLCWWWWGCVWLQLRVVSLWRRSCASRCCGTPSPPPPAPPPPPPPPPPRPPPPPPITKIAQLRRARDQLGGHQQHVWRVWQAVQEVTGFTGMLLWQQQGRAAAWAGAGSGGGLANGWAEGGSAAAASGSISSSCSGSEREAGVRSLGRSAVFALGCSARLLGLMGQQQQQQQQQQAPACDGVSWARGAPLDSVSVTSAQAPLMTDVQAR